jgi:hypothetical protein
MDGRRSSRKLVQGLSLWRVVVVVVVTKMNMVRTNSTIALFIEGMHAPLPATYVCTGVTSSPVCLFGCSWNNVCRQAIVGSIFVTSVT